MIIKQEFLHAKHTKIKSKNFSSFLAFLAYFAGKILFPEQLSIQPKNYENTFPDAPREIELEQYKLV